MHPVPEEGVSGTEYIFRTVEACFLHRMPQKMRRVPQEACFLHRAHIPYPRRPFPVPNISSVPETPVFYTEYLRKRAAYPRKPFWAPSELSVPEEALSGTEFFKLPEKGEHCPHRMPFLVIARATVSYIDIIREPQEKEDGQTVISDDLSVLAPLVGLEPTTP